MEISGISPIQRKHARVPWAISSPRVKGFVPSGLYPSHNPCVSVQVDPVSLSQNWVRV